MFRIQNMEQNFSSILFKGRNLLCSPHSICHFCIHVECVNDQIKSFIDLFIKCIKWTKYFLIDRLICAIILLLIWLIAFIWCPLWARNFSVKCSSEYLWKDNRSHTTQELMKTQFLNEFRRYKTCFSFKTMNFTTKLIIFLLILSFIEAVPVSIDQNVRNEVLNAANAKKSESFIETKTFNKTKNLFLKSNTKMEKKNFFGFLIVPCKFMKTNLIGVWCKVTVFFPASIIFRYNLFFCCKRLLADFSSDASVSSKWDGEKSLLLQRRPHTTILSWKIWFPRCLLSSGSV